MYAPGACSFPEDALMSRGKSPGQTAARRMREAKRRRSWSGFGAFGAEMKKKFTDSSRIFKIRQEL